MFEISALRDHQVCLQMDNSGEKVVKPPTWKQRCRLLMTLYIRDLQGQ